MSKTMIDDQIVTQRGSIDFFLQKLGRKFSKEEIFNLQRDILTLLQAYDEQ